MKKQKFHPNHFKYEPIRQQKQPIWMHSIEKHETGKTKPHEILIMFLIVLFIFSLAIIIGK